MSIKVSFSVGSNSVSVSGLYQWDYGQVLEIESADIETEIVEVHFATPYMPEALVRSCSFKDGVGIVTIPDACLEEAFTLTAWIYRINGTQGHTWKTITMPIMGRTRPAANRDIPHEISDKYTELLTEVNGVVDALEQGNISVVRAQSAGIADHAATAGNAESAGYAVAAGSATTATNAEHATTADSATNAINAETAITAESATSATKATKATQDGSGNNIASTYAKKTDLTNGNITVSKANNASALTTTEQHVSTVGTSGAEVTLKYGKTYIIAFRADRNTNTTSIDNVLVYIPYNDTSGYVQVAYSMPCRYSIVAKVEHKTGNNWTLSFEDEGGNKRTASAVTLREI